MWSVSEDENLLSMCFVLLLIPLLHCLRLEASTSYDDYTTSTLKPFGTIRTAFGVDDLVESQFAFDSTPRASLVCLGLRSPHTRFDAHMRSLRADLLTSFPDSEHLTIPASSTHMSDFDDSVLRHFPSEHSGPLFVYYESLHEETDLSDFSRTCTLAHSHLVSTYGPSSVLTTRFEQTLDYEDFSVEELDGNHTGNVTSPTGITDVDREEYQTILWACMFCLVFIVGAIYSLASIEYSDDCREYSQTFDDDVY